MARIAIGDIQGCHDELRELLRTARFSADRDELWFVGDLVNRGPDSLGVLRFVRALGPNARVVLGNHDLHLLAVARSTGARRLRKDDTLDEVLAAPDRETLLDWLQSQPLAVHAPGRDGARDDLMVRRRAAGYRGSTHRAAAAPSRASSWAIGRPWGSSSARTCSRSTPVVCGGAHSRPSRSTSRGAIGRSPAPDTAHPGKMPP